MKDFKSRFIFVGDDHSVLKLFSDGILEKLHVVARDIEDEYPLTRIDSIGKIVAFSNRKHLHVVTVREPVTG